MEKVKKPLYKRWWVILLGVFFVFCGWAIIEQNIDNKVMATKKFVEYMDYSDLNKTGIQNDIVVYEVVFEKKVSKDRVIRYTDSCIVFDKIYNSKNVKKTSYKVYFGDKNTFRYHVEYHDGIFYDVAE